MRARLLLTAAVIGALGRGSTVAQSVASVRPGWTGLVESRGRCYYAVPAEWMPATDVPLASGRGPGEGDPDGGGSILALSPDGSVSIVLVWTAARSWEALVTSAKSALHPVATRIDSPQRFVAEYVTPLPGAHTYAAVPASGGACVLYVDVLPRAATMLRTVAGEVIETLAALR